MTLERVLDDKTASLERHSCAARVPLLDWRRRRAWTDDTRRMGRRDSHSTSRTRFVRCTGVSDGCVRRCQGVLRDNTVVRNRGCFSDRGDLSLSRL